ncbi:hypothetical protein [Spiroplasma endosymbiont of Othius punctulatus]|uniref:hypothetical protein n=1 Tax=Spiroplasma endosymbiont of Othius punctulatus TaxID=3066289 RepID=UPI0030CDEFC2
MDLKFVRNKDFWEKRIFKIIKTELLYLHASAESRQSWLTSFTYDAINVWSNSSSILEFELDFTKVYKKYLEKKNDNFEKRLELEDTFSKIISTAGVFRVFLDELDNYFEKLTSNNEEIIFDILASHLVFIHLQTSTYFKTLVLNQTLPTDTFKTLSSYYKKEMPKQDVPAGELIDLMYDILNWTVTLYGELLEVQSFSKLIDYTTDQILHFARDTGTIIYFFLYFAESILDEFNIGDERIDELLEYENDKWNEITESENIDNIKTHLLNN